MTRPEIHLSTPGTPRRATPDGPPSTRENGSVSKAPLTAVAAFQQSRHFGSPIDLRFPFANGNFTPTGQRLGEHEDAGGTRALVFVVDPLAVLGGGGDGRTRFLQQLHRLLVHTEDWKRGIIRPLVDFQHFFHVSNKFAVGFWRNHPILDFPIRHAVFFSVRRTVS